MCIFVYPFMNIRFINRCKQQNAKCRECKQTGRKTAQKVILSFSQTSIETERAFRVRGIFVHSTLHEDAVCFFHICWSEVYIHKTKNIIILCVIRSIKYMFRLSHLTGKQKWSGSMLWSYWLSKMNFRACMCSIVSRGSCFRHPIRQNISWRS